MDMDMDKVKEGEQYIECEVIDNEEANNIEPKESQTNDFPDANNVDVINVEIVKLPQKTWNPPERKPSKTEEKIMFAEVLSIIVKVLMNFHLYTFGGDLRVQEGNGSIGDRATGIIAQLVMVCWDRMFRRKPTELGVLFDMIKRYIDDVDGVLNVIEPGTEYKDGKLSVNPDKIESDKKIEDDERTMEVIKDIANDVNDMIKMTVDVPSKHPDNKLPILDLMVWLSEPNQL